jgi:hypothetical protein
MATGTLSIVASVGGRTLQKTISEEFDHPNTYEEIPLAGGQAVTSWVKTDADTAECVLSDDHGYSSGKFDVFWTGGMRYDVDGTVTVNALALDSGSGDDFPASASEDVVVCPHQQINTAIDGDEIQLLVINSTTRAHLHFEDSGGSTVKDLELSSDSPFTWSTSSSDNDNSPLTGNPITVCYASCGATTAGVLDILSGEDATP